MTDENYLLAHDAERLNARFAAARNAASRERARAEAAEAKLAKVAALADEWEQCDSSLDFRVNRLRATIAAEELTR
jgi:hypothetical protein